jgi:hypothetical protein
MHKFSRFAAALGCVAALGMAACSGNGGVTPSAGSNSQLKSGGGLGFDAGWVQKDGITYHVPHYMATRPATRGQVKPMGLLTYRGGPVQVTPTVFLIFWNVAKYGDRQGVEPLLTNYIGHMGGSAHNNIYVQYSEVVNGNTIYVTNPSNQYGGSWEDSTNLEPRHPTDSQIAAEAIRGVQHFGYNASASYVVVTPHGRSTSGFGTQWCAYHSATTSNGNLVSYTDLPYIPDAGANCGSNIISPPSDESGADEGVTIVEGHEQGESVTDPNPPTGWYNNSYGEIGDICAWTNIQNDPFGSFSYSSQPMYSNASNSCVHSYP